MPGQPGPHGVRDAKIVAVLTRRPHAIALAALLLALPVPGATDSGAPRGHVNMRGAEVLRWSQAQKLSGFPRMEALFPARTVAAGSRPRALPSGLPLATFEAGGAQAPALEAFIAAEHIAGLLVLHDGRIRLERYALGHSAAGRWTSFSVAKSLTSTLVGAAIKDGHIGGLDEPVTRYIGELRGTAYEGVTVHQLLTMTSGVAFNEDYGDPDSDIARLYREPPEPGLDATVSFVRSLGREAEPGTKWRYKTPETNLAGTLVMAATGKSLAEYLSNKIWRPYGMEQEATWLVDHVGHEQGGCCLQAGLRDYARFGQFILEGAKLDGASILPDGWLEAATRKQADTGLSEGGYGYQWWPAEDGSFQARGIFGQLLHIDPARKLVVAISAAWPEARAPARRAAQAALIDSIAAVLDAEAAGHE